MIKKGLKFSIGRVWCLEPRHEHVGWQYINGTQTTTPLTTPPTLKSIMGSLSKEEFSFFFFFCLLASLSSNHFHSVTRTHVFLDTCMVFCSFWVPPLKILLFMSPECLFISFFFISIACTNKSFICREVESMHLICSITDAPWIWFHCLDLELE